MDKSGKIFIGQNTAETCFICNKKSSYFKNISESKSCVSNTSYAQCIGQIIGSNSMVVISNDDLVCQHCSSLIDQRDDLLFSAQQIETALGNYLKHRYNIIDNISSTSSSSNILQLDAGPASDKTDYKSPVKRTVIVSVRKKKKTSSSKQNEAIQTDLFPNEQDLIFEESGENLQSDENLDCTQYFLCESCNFSTESSKEMKKHSLLHKQEEMKQKLMAGNVISPVEINFTCLHCKLIMQSESEYLRHCMYHRKPGQIIICCECGEENENMSILKAHMVQCHQCLLDCNECGEQFQQEQFLKIHIQNHEKGKQLTCHQCKLCFSSLSDLAYHVDKIHNVKKCEVCGKEYTDLGKFKSHANYHKKIKKNSQCPYCDKIFKTTQGLKSHIAQHTGEFKFKCEICGKGSSQLKTHREHMNQHSDNPQTFYKCNKCDKEFKHYGSYYSHRVWHDNPYPFVCKYCGLKVRHRQLLTVHVRKEHTFESPYKCEICDKEFLMKRLLKLHMQRHDGVKNHFCGDCGKGFLLLSHLRVHQSRIHGHQHHEKMHINDEDYKVVIPGQPAQHMPHSDDDSS